MQNKHMAFLKVSAVAVSGKVGHSLTGLTTPVGVTVVTPTDRPKSVRNRCVIEVLVDFLCCHIACRNKKFVNAISFR